MPQWFSQSFIARYQLFILVGVIVLGWILWQLSDFVLLLFLSYILMAALLPFTELLEKHRIPKVFGILVVLLVVTGIIWFIVQTFIPLIISQTQVLFINSPRYLNALAKFFHVRINVSSLESFVTSRIDTISSNVVSFVTDAFVIFFTISTFLIITFYLLMDHEKIQFAFLRLFPRKMQGSIASALVDINQTLGDWVRGQVLLSFSVGFCSWLVYLLVHLPYALPLGVFAGIMEIVPTIGPLIAFMPAVIIGLTISPLTAVFVAIGYIVVQMLEGNILVPKIMQHSVGLHPLAVILAIVLGGRFFGLLGALLSVPFLAVVTIIYNRIT